VPQAKSRKRQCGRAQAAGTQALDTRNFVARSGLMERNFPSQGLVT
jgi:hypothetical protein